MLLPQTKNASSKHPNKYELFDDAFNFSDMTKFHEFFVTNTLYRIGWQDREDTKNRSYMHSHYSLEDMKNLEFIDRIKSPKLLELINGRIPTKIVINVTNPCYVFYPHVHHNHDSLVYYANLEWPQDWAGETMIYEDDGVNILTCMPFRPGRVLWLKNQVVHALRPPSVIADVHRITLSCFFEN